MNRLTPIPAKAVVRAESLLAGDLASPHSLASLIPRWHFAMINDNERNVAFAKAIAALDLRGKTVLDIGTGTGLLSMLAARRGAEHVYTCESNEAIAGMAAKIIDNNGHSDRVTVISKLSTDLVPGSDLPSDIDVLISETVDCGFVGEGFLPALIHAKRELLVPEPQMTPVRFALRACLLSSEAIFDLNRARPIFGFNVSDFNGFSTPGYFPVRLGTWDHKLVSAPVECVSFDLHQEQTFVCSKPLDFSVNSDCAMHGVLFWFEIWLRDGISLTNAPGNFRSHWMQAVQVFEKPMFAVRGEIKSFYFTMEPRQVVFSPASESGLLGGLGGSA